MSGVRFADDRQFARVFAFRQVAWSEDCLAVARELCKAQRLNPKTRKTARAANLLAGEFASAQLELMKKREQWLTTQLNAQTTAMVMSLEDDDESVRSSSSASASGSVGGAGSPKGVGGRELKHGESFRLTRTKSIRRPSSLSSVSHRSAGAEHAPNPTDARRKSADNSTSPRSSTSPKSPQQPPPKESGDDDKEA